MMEIEWNKALNQNDDLTQFKWEIGLCISGEDCWCRTISVKDKYYPNDKETACIIPSGSVGKLEAEHIVSTFEFYLTWEGYDFLESLNKELQQPLNEKTESTADYQKDILEILNENIVKEIDKEEWNKVLNQSQYNFLVIEILEDHGYIEELNCIQKFQSRVEAEYFIKCAEDKYNESVSNKYNYVKNYVTNASQETINEFFKQLVFFNKPTIDYLISTLSTTELVVVEGYDPPKVVNYHSNFYHILEIKEN